MNDDDKKILNLVQRAFPVTAAPFRDIAEKAGIGDQDVFECIKRLKQKGVIRRIGAVFDSRRLGFVSTLCAARIPEEKLKDFIEVINAYPGITHHYRRKHQYNIWFTFIAPDEEALKRSLTDIMGKTGIAEILDLRAVRTFKIDARFNF